jgi:hypothetical protein
VFAAASIALEVAFGSTLRAATPPGPAHGIEDALWHLATALALVVPARRRTLLWIAPLMSLAVDVDHAFGSLLPTVVGRQAHSFVFLVVASVVLGHRSGATGALLGAGALLSHMAVDGGAFPILVPLSTAAVAAPLGLQLLGVATAELCFFLSTRSAKEALRLEYLVPLVTAGALVGGILAFAPGLIAFNLS